VPEQEISVVLADDQPAVRGGLRRSLASEPDIRLVAEAADGREAIQAVAAYRPAVLLVGIEMPELNGLDATRAVSAVAPATAVLMLSGDEDDESVFAAVRAGARGAVAKDAEPAEIVAAVRCVAGGGVRFGPRIARWVGELLSGGPDGLPNMSFPQLTVGEREVLDLVADGLANGQISDRLRLAAAVVGDRVSSIRAKLQDADRAQLIARAHDTGIGRRA
jgi:DNA-binding NarL/FixJ family response regulator